MNSGQNLTEVDALIDALIRHKLESASRTVSIVAHPRIIDEFLRRTKTLFTFIPLNEKAPPCYHNVLAIYAMCGRCVIVLRPDFNAKGFRGEIL